MSYTEQEEPPAPGFPWAWVAGIIAMTVVMLGGGWLIGTSSLFSNPGALAILPVTTADGAIARDPPVEGLMVLFGTDLAAAAEVEVAFHAAPGPNALAALRRSLRDNDRTRFVMDGTASVAGQDVRLRLRLTDLQDGTEIWAGEIAGTGQGLFPAMADTVRLITTLIRRNPDFRHGRAPPPDAVADRLAKALRTAADWFPVEPAPRPWANVSRIYELAAELDPTDPAIVGRLAVRQTFAWLQGFPSDNESLDRIADLVARAAAIDPKHQDYLLARCFLLRARRQFEEAVEACRFALDLHPKLTRAAIELGHDELELWRPDEALRWYRHAEAMVQEPDERWSNLRGMAIAYYLQGDQERAVFSMEQAAAIRPADPVAQGWLAALLALSGRTDDARVQAATFFALPAEGTRKQGELPRIHLLSAEYDGRHALIANTLNRLRPRSGGPAMVSPR